MFFMFCLSHKLFQFVNNIHDKVMNNYLLNSKTIYNFIFSNREIFHISIHCLKHKTIKGLDFLKLCLNNKLFQFRNKICNKVIINCSSKRKLFYNFILINPEIFLISISLHKKSTYSKFHLNPKLFQVLLSSFSFKL